MSLANIAGGRLAFPINGWLVRNHLKHGCMNYPAPMARRRVSVTARRARTAVTVQRWHRNSYRSGRHMRTPRQRGIAGTFVVLAHAFWLTAQ
jgi:hypothetical protein